MNDGSFCCSRNSQCGRMGKDFKSIGVGDGGQRDARSIRHPNGEGSGVDTATISGAPIAAVFCTISTETRLVSSTCLAWWRFCPGPARH